MDFEPVEQRTQRLLGRTAAERDRLNRRRLRSLALGVAVVSFMVAVLLSAAAMQAIRGDGCPLPALRLDVDAVRQVDASWLPPTVACEYRLASGEVGQERDRVWSLFAPGPALLLLAGAATWWRRLP